MNYRIKIIFSNQPEIDDSITVNAQFIQTFKASRNNLGEVAIGATLNDTIVNLQNALIEDYQALFPFTTSIEGSTLILNFINYNDTFFDLSTTSNVITFELITGYFPYFVSKYDNKVDNFELVISGDDPTFTQENITATAKLSYKDVDNILQPIRGAQLDIDINANIDKPFDLFLDFREKDFKVKFYRNDDLIFEGFVNPEGVTQDYTSINWRAQIVAVDNLGALKNTELNYTNELPSEFVMMDLALKATGLNLPIAFFDDINKKVRINNVTQNYGQTLDDGFNERLINPDVFKNKNGRFKNSEFVLKDILYKYNALIVQQNITFYNIATNENENKLCWLFCRIPLLTLSFQQNQQTQYKVKEITKYSNGSPVIVQYQDLSFANPTVRLGTDGENNLDAIHKNKNQLIRQTRALKAFRFVQNWVTNPTVIDFSFDIFSYIGNSLNQYRFYSTNPDFAYWIALGSLTTWNNSFDPTLPIDSNNDNSFVEISPIDIPDDATEFKMSGNGVLFEFGGSLNLNVFLGIQFQMLHIDNDGNRYWLVSPPNNGVYTVNQFFVNASNTFNQSQWIKDDEIQQDGNGVLDLRNISNTLFNYFGQDLPVDLDFEIKTPPLVGVGGSIEVYFSPLFIRNSLLDSISQNTDAIRFAMTDLKFELVSPPELGLGNYYDASNTQDVSTKIGDPIEIVNADDKSNIYLNSLKRRDNINDENLQNYSYWTSVFNLEPNKSDILKLTSIERIRLLSKSQNIFSGDIHGYIPYFSKIINTAYVPQELVPGNFGIFHFVFTKWIYDTVNNTIESEMMECNIFNPSVNYEKSVIFEDEDKKLID